MSWLYLLIAGLLEVLGVIWLKPICTLKTKFYIVLMAITFILVLVFKISYDNNSNGNGRYAIWTGISTAGGAIVGMLFYKESTHFSRIIFIFLILFSVIGLKMI